MQTELTTIDFSLGENLRCLSFSGRFSMSQPFFCDIELLSAKEITPSEAINKPISLLMSVDKAVGYVSGIVVEISAQNTDMKEDWSYRLGIVPWLNFLDYTSDCCVYQQKTTVEIVTGIFDKLGYSDYKVDVKSVLEKREYCVQYNETAFDFVSRLLQDEGIYYYFIHEKNKHTLVLSDDVSAYQAASGDKISYQIDSGGKARLMQWRHEYRYASGKYSETDYDFETPDASLLSSQSSVIKLQQNEKFERFEYPGGFITSDKGKAKVKKRIEAEEAASENIAGSSNCVSFLPGYLFELDGHPVKAENQKYVLTSVEITISSNPHGGGSTSENAYHNTFTCIPAARIFRPFRRTLKPIISGLQTATVVGVSGQEITTDQYARVKVQFHWDRYGKSDEKSSCWVRVAQQWAGKKWGQIFIPRVGQEVVVSFLDGDPDKPLIIGSVYNGNNMPPYGLPDSKTQSGIKSQSTEKGGESDNNELRFEDKKDSEQVYLHAQKDMQRIVENDDETNIKHDQKLTVENDHTVIVNHDQTATIKNNRTHTISEGNDALNISKGNYTVAVNTGNHQLGVDKGSSSVSAQKSIDLAVGSNSINIDTSSMTHTVGANSISMDASGITLTVGANSVKIDNMGVTVNGQMVTVKGSIVQTSSDALLELKGGMVTIN